MHQITENRVKVGSIGRIFKVYRFIILSSAQKSLEPKNYGILGHNSDATLIRVVTILSNALNKCKFAKARYKMQSANRISCAMIPSTYLVI